MATPLDAPAVERIARLAHLALTPDEVQLFARQLGDILGYVEQIRAVDTTDVAPTSHVLSEPLERPDAVHTSLDRAQALANAPDAAIEAGLFKVPRVLG